MKRLLIAGLSLLIFCFTSSLAIGEEVMASLADVDSIKQADTKKNVSNLPQEPVPSFMDKYKEQKWNIAVGTCGPASENRTCTSGEQCCHEVNGTVNYWCQLINGFSCDPKRKTH